MKLCLIVFAACLAACGGEVDMTSSESNLVQQQPGYECHFDVPGAVFGLSGTQHWVSGDCCSTEQPWGFTVLTPRTVSCHEMPANDRCPLGKACIAVLPVNATDGVTGGPKYGHYAGVCGL